MKIAINLALILLTALLSYWLYASVREPIAFAKERDKRKDAVVNVMKRIQIAQDIYRSITGKYANSFDSLASTIRNGKITIEKIDADPADPTNEDKFIRSYSYVPAIDSFNTLMVEMGNNFNVDSLKYIPFTEGNTFEIAADTLTYQNTLVNVVEVKTKYATFMGPYKDPKYRKYDAYYDPEKYIKFGDLNAPNTNGNW